MDPFGTVVAILNGRFPGQFDCKPGVQGQASGLVVRRAGRDGHAFLFDQARQGHFLLSLHEFDGDEREEVRSTNDPDECVRHILGWAFPPEWTAPGPVNRKVEKRRLAAISAGLAARGRTSCWVTEPDPELWKLVGAEGRQAFDRDHAAVDAARLRRNFPWDAAGRLALDSAVLLNAYPTGTPPARDRVVCLAALGPARRRDDQEIRIGLEALIPINQSHRWHDRPWMWQRVAAPERETLGLDPGRASSIDREERERAARSLQFLDEGRIEEALALHDVALSDDLHRLLGGQRIRPPACCAHPDDAWTRLLIGTLRQSAPWLLVDAAEREAGRIRACTGKTSVRTTASSWKLATFPGQSHARKACLMLTQKGRPARLEIDATATNARLAETSWKRPLDVDLVRHGIPPP